MSFEDIFIDNCDISNLLLFDYFDNEIVVALRATSRKIASQTKYFYVSNYKPIKIYRINTNNNILSNVEWATITIEQLQMALDENIRIGAFELLLVILGDTLIETCNLAFNAYITQLGDNDTCKALLYKCAIAKIHNCGIDSFMDELIKKISHANIYERYKLITHFCNDELQNLIHVKLVNSIYCEELIEEYIKNVTLNNKNNMGLDEAIHTFVTNVVLRGISYCTKAKTIKYMILKYNYDVRKIHKFAFADLKLHMELVKECIFINVPDYRLNEIEYNYFLYDVKCPNGYFNQSLDDYITQMELYVSKENKSHLYANCIYKIFSKNIARKQSIMENIKKNSMEFFYNIVDNLSDASALKYIHMELCDAVYLANNLAKCRPTKKILLCSEWLVSMFPEKKVINIIGHYLPLETIIKLNIPIKKKMLYSLRFDVIKYIVENYPDYVYNHRFAYELLEQDKKYIANTLKYMQSKNINIIKFLSKIGTINIFYHVQWLKLFGTIVNDNCKDLLHSIIIDYRALPHRPYTCNMCTDETIHIYSENNIKYGGYTPYRSPWRHSQPPAKFLACNGYLDFEPEIKDVVCKYNHMDQILFDLFGNCKNHS